jgi:hypothetical protein
MNTFFTTFVFMEKMCSKCEKIKNLSEFYSSIRMKDKLDSYCKVCRYAHTKSRVKIERARRKEKIKNDPVYRENHLRVARESNVRNIHRIIFGRTRYRALQRNIEFNLTIEDIIIPEYCPILGVKLVVGTAKDYEHSPSIDRIDNSKGYIKGNIAIISKKANSMKNSATLEELIKFANWVINQVKI